MKKHYCLQCGTELSRKTIENRTREVCPACGWIHYEQLKVGAGALVQEDGRLLLVHRAQDPWKGYWYLPAGYVEADEDPRKAAERETLEETGLEVAAGDLLDVVYYDDDPRGNGLLILYACRLLGGSLKNSPESLESGFFSIEDMPGPIAGLAHNQVLNRWKAEQNKH